MKKILSVIIIAMMITAMFIPMYGHADNNSLGNIPKAAFAPSIDGVKDGIYDDGLYVSVRTPHDATPTGGLGGGGDAWLLWDDGSLYVFMSVDVKGYYHPDNYDTRQVDSPWDLTTVEVLIDLSNAGSSNADVAQFRLNDSGFPNVTIGTSDGWYSGDDCDKFMDYGFVKNSDSYTVEMRIDYKAVKADGDTKAMNVGDAWDAGKNVGIYLFSQELSEDGSSSALFISNPTDRSGNWEPLKYDYIVLSDEVVGLAEIIIEEEAEAAPAAATAVTPVVTAPVKAAQTSDTAIVCTVMLAISCAGLIVFKKRKS